MGNRGEHRSDAERATLAGVNVELPNEFSRFGEFYDFAGVGRIAVDGVAIGRGQIPVRRKYQRQRPAQVPIRKDQGARRAAE